MYRFERPTVINALRSMFKCTVRELLRRCPDQLPTEFITAGTEDAASLYEWAERANHPIQVIWLQALDTAKLGYLISSTPQLSSSEAPMPVFRKEALATPVFAPEFTFVEIIDALLTSHKYCSKSTDEAIDYYDRVIFSTGESRAISIMQLETAGLKWLFPGILSREAIWKARTFRIWRTLSHIEVRDAEVRLLRLSEKIEEILGEPAPRNWSQSIDYHEFCYYFEVRKFDFRLVARLVELMTKAGLEHWLSPDAFSLALMATTHDS